MMSDCAAIPPILTTLAVHRENESLRSELAALQEWRLQAMATMAEQAALITILRDPVKNAADAHR